MNDSEVVGNGLKTIYYKRSRRETTTVDKSTNEVGRIILTHNKQMLTVMSLKYTYLVIFKTIKGIVYQG